MGSTTLARKLRKNLYLKAYLCELNILLGRRVSADELANDEATTALMEKVKKFADIPRVGYEANFSELKSNHFKSFTTLLCAKNNQSIYVWTPRTLDCGVISAPSIGHINFAFDFDFQEEGIVSFITKDLCNQMILDFYESDIGERRVVIEIQGDDWLPLPF